MKITLPARKIEVDQEAWASAFGLPAHEVRADAEDLLGRIVGEALDRYLATNGFGEVVR